MIRHALAASVAASTLVGTVGLVPSAQAATDASGVVISEVYGGGGSASSALARDYVELANPTSSPVDLSGLSVQYRSSGGTANPTGVTPLSGTIPAHGRFLVGEATGTAGAAIPTPDVEGSIAMSGSAGTVFLARGTAPLTAPRTGSLTGDPAVLDLVGYGSTNTFEKAPTAAPSATTSVQRSATEADTDDNAADLVVATPTPGAASSSTGGSGDPAPAPVERSIAEVQGAGPASPYAGQAVTVTGVVTAAYPTGGINGFYLQTAGTGSDLTTANQGAHTASDAVLVYGSAATAKVRPGDHVRVTGKVSEYQGTTEITPSAADVEVLATPAAPVTPARVSVPRTEAGRESLEGMLLAPQGPFTVADVYGLNSHGEVGLASGTTPLVAPTEVADAQDTAAIARLTAENTAREVTLDDGATTDFLRAGKDTPLPYLTQDHQVRVGAPVTFTAPVVLEDRYDAWRLQPTSQLTAEGTPPATFAHTRTARPLPVGGTVKIASFNVLNYFPTTGADVVAAGGTCSFYSDRTGEPVTVNSCTTATGGDGPRGAADDADLARQQAKIVAAIDGLGADVVSLEEIENSAKFGQDRDAAVGRLVGALNAADTAAGRARGRWRYVPSPDAANSPEAQADEDVIRTAFVYRSGVVHPVGPSVIDDVPVFDVARDPLAQAFATRGGGKKSRFTVIVNHLKSKGSGVDDGTGQGNSNPTRVAQAREVVRFAHAMERRLGTPRQFLTGDFNAYTQEDPMQELYSAGWTDIGSRLHPEEHTYLFSGRVGSLDHVLGNAAAMRTVRGAHVWNLSSVESVALEYSRFDYNATNFFEPGPYRSSDHDPLLVGLGLPLEGQRH